MKAIETHYKGYRFRSRLEARWAVFFDALNVKYDYEREGYKLDNGLFYLPDFYLPDANSYVEIKPQNDSFNFADEKKWMGLAKDIPGAVLVCIGNPWLSEHILCMVWGEMAFRYCLWAECYGCGSLGVLCFVGMQVTEYMNKRDPSIEVQMEPTCLFCLSSSCGIGEDRAGYEINPKLDHNPTKTPRLLAAYKAARSARFEHGEKPFQAGG